ncbi:hypothetical protein V490_00367 [Pseudogymnoascus sp. VKM F-3557]|nr:hypothetical protein V490_00367 [Pseudogymnoascus sp. VKM F-3557]
MGTASRGTTHLPITGGFDGTLQSTYWISPGEDSVDTCRWTIPLGGPYAMKSGALLLLLGRATLVLLTSTALSCRSHDLRHLLWRMKHLTSAASDAWPARVPTSRLLHDVRKCVQETGRRGPKNEPERCLADESADQSPTSWCREVRTRNRPERDQRMSPKKVAEIVETLVEALNKRKRQRLIKVGSSRPAGWYKALADEWDAKPSDPVATDKSDIEQELRSGSSILVLESTPSRRSHCRALLCLRHQLTGIINIESDYRFNLKDLTGRWAGDLSHHYVSCTENTYREADLN